MENPNPLTGENQMKRNVPIIDIIFKKGVNGTVSDTISNKRIICAFPSEDILTNAVYDTEGEGATGLLKEVSPRAMTKFTRKINKNPIYINFPVESETSGGYAYDLGFTEDTFSISMATMEWNEYEKLCKLVKINVGEKPATIHIGKIPKEPSSTTPVDPDYKWTAFISTGASAYKSSGWSESGNTSTSYPFYGCHTYNCIIRNSDATLEPGTQMINYSIECTVVYNE